MKRLAYSVALFAAVTTVMAVCYRPDKEPCPGTGISMCPDGSGHAVSHCDAANQKETNSTASSGAWGTTNFTGSCRYACYYIYTNTSGEVKEGVV